ncbi:hypothetical protein Pla163_28270 [Planctomycetes bacterium Pla163]|uniref:Uncharacterized protein n=1 Tax=Rohdeia mirabilis TaxID=2528008 RepID=A0A518D2J6_9BACT|nr:hypothetical protein Pla163_28270 [Planctomycetes bacterium Pla163]
MRPLHHRAPRRPAAARRGTSLVELMFAAVVLVVGISAAALQSARAHELRRHTEERLTATAHLRSVMSTILERSPAELLAADSEWAAGVVDVSANLVRCLPDQRTTVEYPGYAAGDAAPNLLPVVVRVDWDSSRGDAKTLELCSVVKR